MDVAARARRPALRRRHRDRPPARPPGVGALRRAAPRRARPGAGRGGSASCCAARCRPPSPSTSGWLIAAVTDGDGADRAARHDGRRVRRQPGHRPAARGARLRPRQPHGHVAQRPPDGGDARPAGRRPPRARRPHRRPVDGPRLRPRHHRPAAVVQHELHRRRARRARHRRRLGRRAGLVRLVAGDRARARLVGDALDAARERASGSSGARRRSCGPSASPTTPTASPSTRRRPRRCACSGSPTGSSIASPASAGTSTTCSTRRPGCASGRCSAALAHRRWWPTWLAFWTLGVRAADGELALSAAIVALQAAIGVSAIAFGGLNWALDGAAAPVAAVVAARSRRWRPAGALADGRHGDDARRGHGPELRFRDVSFALPRRPARARRAST